MNREIKFRVWSGNMFLDGGDANIHCVDNDKTEIELEASYPHSKHILCQFTGLKDKNGKEIYEFDYLEIPEVNDNSKTWCVFWGSGKYILHNISTGDILDCNEENTNKKEITGNRFESPRKHKTMETDL